MDRKTLEYMEERAIKARKIVNRIDALKKNIETLKHTDKCFFNYSASAGYHVEETQPILVSKMKTAFGTIVCEEIERLEQELAEL